MRTMLLVLSGLVTISAVSACSGDYGSSGEGADAGGTLGADAGAPAPTPTAPSGGKDAGRTDAAADAGPVDAAADATDGAVALPVTTCSTDAIPANAANQRCRAANATVVAGGTPLAGIYLLTSVTSGSYCPAAGYYIGWATLYTDSSSHVFFRYNVGTRVAISDPLTKHEGTSYLTYDATTGAYVRTELCDAATKNTAASGTLSMTGNVLTFTTATGQEQWTRQ
jgi:hypothetical protein